MEVNLTWVVCGIDLSVLDLGDPKIWVFALANLFLMTNKMLYKYVRWHVQNTKVNVAINKWVQKQHIRAAGRTISSCLPHSKWGQISGQWTKQQFPNPCKSGEGLVFKGSSSLGLNSLQMSGAGWVGWVIWRDALFWDWSWSIKTIGSSNTRHRIVSILQTVLNIPSCYSGISDKSVLQK